MKKMYLGVIRDHSGSMSSKARAAMNDFNAQIQATADSAAKTGMEVTVSVIECGVPEKGGFRVNTTNNRWDAVLRPVEKIAQLTSYPCPGNTPLYDAIGKMIEHFNLLPDIKEAQVLIEILSDGEENGSRLYNCRMISDLIKEKDREDNWTIAARTNSALSFTDIGIHRDNIHIWDGQTSESLNRSSVVASSARTTYMASVASGTMRKTDKFYTDLSGVSSAQVASTMTDISKNVRVYTTTGVEEIKPFVERMTGAYVKGTAFYQLTKTEDTVQDYKNIIIVDKTSGAAYAGKDARSLLGLPTVGNCKIVPGNHGNFEIYIQSTSINRKLPASTKLIIWDPMSQIQPAPAKQPVQVIQPPTTPVAKFKPTAAATIVTTSQTTADSKDSYIQGYKDGKRKQKNKASTYTNTNDAFYYALGFQDGKAKVTPKFTL